MFRKLIPWIGILVLAIAVTACSSATSNTAASAPTSPAASSNGATTTEAATEPAETGSVATAAAKSGLSAEEVADLLHMREEEKLARDVYLALYDKWGLTIFQNIAKAEQTHMDAVGDLLKTYGIPDPVAKTKDARGVFESPKLQDLYKQLVAQGSASEIDALKVGATIEDLDIKDLNEAISRTTHSDIQQVYENLKRGSENHMRAFMSNLRARGADYTPQYISEAEFQQILQGSNGKGGGNNGQGNGG